MKKILLGTVFGVVGLVAACSSTGTLQFPTLTLANVQAQVTAIETGINEAAVIAETSGAVSPTVAAEIKTSVATFDTVANGFVGLGPTASAAQAADAVVSAAEAVVAVLPIDPATKTAVELGLAVVEAFAGGATTSPVAVAVTPTAAVGAEFGKVAPIVPIPVPSSMPKN